MLVDFIIDTICPWCYIGKRRFDKAFQLRPDVTPDIQYRPFLLNPDMPLEGVDKELSIKQKFGSRDAYDKIIHNIKEVGLSEDIDFNLDKIKRTPNSAFSHILIQLGQTVGVHDEIVNSLLSAYFEQGQDISNIDNLKTIGKKAGISEKQLVETLNSETALESIHTQSNQIRRLGVTGVPCYIFNKTQAVSGAQDSEILVKLINLAEPQKQTHNQSEKKLF